MSKPFWADGIRFQCQGTGRCCTARGEYGYVYLDLEERRRVAAFLGLPTATFTRRYCQRDDDEFILKNPQADCLFLENGKCKIYEARPTQCRTWPFWPENMSRAAWHRDVAGFCAGVGKGPVVSADEIRALLDLHRRRY